MKLESIANTNDITNFTAHDAMGDTYASLELAKLIKSRIPKLWQQSISQGNKNQLEETIGLKPFCHLESFFGKAKLFCLSFIGFHPKYKWALCFDLLEDPKRILEMNGPDIYIFEESPKKIRKLKLNKSPILLDMEIRKNLNEYNTISDETLLERHYFISNNDEFKNKVLSCYNEDIVDNRN